MSRPVVLVRAPFTIGAVALVLALAVLTHALWDPVADRPMHELVGYGVPALERGRWWTVLMGLPFALHPAEYVPLLVGLVVLGGFAESRSGDASSSRSHWGGSCSPSPPPSPSCS